VPVVQSLTVSWMFTFCRPTAECPVSLDLMSSFPWKSIVWLNVQFPLKCALSDWMSSLHWNTSYLTECPVSLETRLVWPNVQFPLKHTLFDWMSSFPEIRNACLNVQFLSKPGLSDRMPNFPWHMPSPSECLVSLETRPFRRNFQFPLKPSLSDWMSTFPRTSPCPTV
jgi:hypothetical protein